LLQTMTMSSTANNDGIVKLVAQPSKESDDLGRPSTPDSAFSSVPPFSTTGWESDTASVVSDNTLRHPPPSYTSFDQSTAEWHNVSKTQRDDASEPSTVAPARSVVGERATGSADDNDAQVIGVRQKMMQIKTSWLSISGAFSIAGFTNLVTRNYHISKLDHFEFSSAKIQNSGLTSNLLWHDAHTFWANGSGSRFERHYQISLIGSTG
jgi:hypothetical protein